MVGTCWLLTIQGCCHCFFFSVHIPVYPLTLWQRQAMLYTNGIRHLCELMQPTLPITQPAFMANITYYFVCSWRRQIMGSVDTSLGISNNLVLVESFSVNFRELSRTAASLALRGNGKLILREFGHWLMFRYWSLRLKKQVVISIIISLNKGAGNLILNVHET